MAGVIQYGGIRLDVFVDTKGVRGMRTDMAALTRVVNEAKGAAGSYERNLARLVKLQEEGKLSGEQSKEMLDAIVNKYLKGAKSVAEYEKIIQHLIQTIPALKPQLEAMAKAFKDNADAEALAAAKARQTRKLEKMAREQAMDDVRKQEREAERAARKAQRDADARKAANKKLADSVKEMAAGHSSGMKQVVRDLDMVDKAYRRHKVSTDIADKAINKTLEGFLRSAKGPKAQAAAIAELTAMYPHFQYRIDQIVNKLNAEAAAEKAAATAKKEAAAAKKDADRQMKLDMALVNGLLTKQAGEAGKLRIALDAITRVQKTGKTTQDQVNKAIAQAAKDYAAGAKTLQDLSRLKKQFVGATEAEQAAVNAALRARARELRQNDAQKKADQDAIKAKREKANAEKILAQVMQQGMSAHERLIAQERELISLQQKGLISTQQLTAALQSLARQRQNLSVQGQKGMGMEFGGALLSGLSPFGAITTAAAGYQIGAGSINFAKESAAAYMDMRTALIKLEVVLGSTAKAMRTFSALRQVAVQTSLQANEVVRAAVVMAQFGVSTEDLVPTVRRLAEISAGSSERLQSLALAFGQVTAAGRLTGQEVLQFVNAGFSPLAEMARTSGRSMAELRKEMEAGNLSVQETANTFKTATEEGGRFFGMAAKQSQELAGKINQMTSEWTKFKEAIGELADVSQITRITDAIKIFTDEIKFLKEGRMGPFFDFMQGGIKGTELGNALAPLSPLELMEYQATGMTPAERKRLRDAEIADLVAEEKQREKRRKETAGRIISDAIDSAMNAVAQSAQAFADSMKGTEESLKGLADDAVRNAAKARQSRIKSLLEERKALLQQDDADKERSLEAGRNLPAGAMSRTEMIDLVNKVEAQRKSTEATEAMKEQKKQTRLQEINNKLLEEQKKQGFIGLIL